MAQMPAMPTAHHVALAIVAACRAVGEDPIECASGKLKMRGRYYAFAALRKIFSVLPGTSLARMVGATGKSIACFPSNVANAKRFFTWWDDSVITAVCGAVSPTNDLAPSIKRSPQPEAAIVASPPTPIIVSPMTDAEQAYCLLMSPVSRLTFERMSHSDRRALMVAYAAQHGQPALDAPKIAPSARRITDHRTYGPINMGEPAPGRSALDQKRAAEASRGNAS